MKEKSYSEDEIASIIGSAARLQALQGVEGQRGLTLNEIKEAAAEAGIDSKYIEIASSEVTDHRKSYFSLPTAISRTQFIRGSLTQGVWEELIAHFTRTFGGPGEAIVRGKKRTWKREGVNVTLEELGNQIVINVEEDWGQTIELPIALSLVGFFATIAMAILSVTSQESSIIFATIGMATLLFGTFFTYRRQKQKKQTQILKQFEHMLNTSAIIMQEKEIPDISSSGTRSAPVSTPLEIPDEEQYGEDIDEISGNRNSRRVVDKG